MVIHAQTQQITSFLKGLLNGKIFKHLNAHLRCKHGGQASLKELPAVEGTAPAALVSFLPNLHLLSDANGPPPPCSCKKYILIRYIHNLVFRLQCPKKVQNIGNSAKYWQQCKTVATVQNTGSSAKYWQACSADRFKSLLRGILSPSRKVIFSPSKQR